MRISNRKKSSTYNFIFTISIILLFIGIGLFVIERYKFKVLGWESVFLLLFPLFLIVIIFARGRQIFEYDSDGEALNFNNYHIYKIFNKKSKDEFPKYKLLNFEIIDLWLIKKIYVTISSKKNKSLILKYDVSYLTNKEIKDLRFSLTKIVNANSNSKVNTADNN